MHYNSSISLSLAKFTVRVVLQLIDTPKLE